jgi:hypothetical protein
MTVMTWSAECCQLYQKEDKIKLYSLWLLLQDELLEVNNKSVPRVRSYLSVALCVVRVLVREPRTYYSDSGLLSA